jgi:hypothetical protein
MEVVAGPRRLAVMANSSSASLCRSCDGDGQMSTSKQSTSACRGQRDALARILHSVVVREAFQGFTASITVNHLEDVVRLAFYSNRADDALPNSFLAPDAPSSVTGELQGW